MGERLKGKVAIVTGGAAGIGRATSVLFAREGAKVAVADLDEAAGAETVAEIKAQGGQTLFVATDISREADVRRLCDVVVADFQRLDILVNNAATFVLKGIDATVEDWRQSLNVNVIGTAQMSRYAVAKMKMKQPGGGAIVNVSSISAFVAQPSFVTYSATKAAILQMTRNMAMDLAPFNIRVNCVCPGTILTRASVDHMTRLQIKQEDFIAGEAAKHLLGRIGHAREVAYPILFLASD